MLSLRRTGHPVSSSLVVVGATVLVVALLVALAGSGGAVPTHTGDAGGAAEYGVAANETANGTDAGTDSPPAESLSPGDTVVYDLRTDERLDDGGPTGGTGTDSKHTPLPGTVGPDDNRERVERPWTKLTRHESVVQVQMTLTGGGSSSCTGTIVGPYHVLTAGHCTHLSQFDGWVDDVSVVPMIDTQSGTEVEPYGAAEARVVRTYESWLDQETGVPEHDFALLTLDRSIGSPNATTIMDWGAYPEGDPVYEQDTVYNLGYPGAPPDNEPFPSLWENDGEGLGSRLGNPGTFEVDVVVTGGHSGGPLFHETSSGEYEQLGVAAYTTYGTAFGPRISFRKGNDLANWTSSTEYVDPPDDRPEYVFEGLSYTGLDVDPFDVTPSEDVVPGETELTVEHAIRNVGTARGPDEVGVAFREATGGTCDRSGPVIHNETVSTPAAFNSTDVAFSTTLPANVSEPIDVCLTIESGADEFDDRPPADNVSSVQRLSVFEPADVAASLSDEFADPGETVSIPFDVEPRTAPDAEVSAYDVAIEYDETMLSFVGAAGETLPDPTVGSDSGTLSLVALQTTGEPVPLTAATLEFAVKGDAPDGVAHIEFDRDESELLDLTTEVPAAFEAGGVAVGDAPHPAALRHQIGNVDTDRELDIVDAVRIQRHLAQLDPGPFNAEVADVNRDGNVTIVDAVLIQQSLANIVDTGALSLSNLSADPATGAVDVDVVNDGGTGAVQDLELRIANEPGGLEDREAIVDRQIVDLRGGDATTAGFTVSGDELDAGDWIGLYTDDDEQIRQVTASAD